MQNDVLSNSKKRVLGSVYTPIDIAKSISKITLSKFDKNFINILEPSVGDGNFIEALQFYLTSEFSLTAIDIDSDVINQLEERFEPNYHEKLNFISSDYIQYSTSLNNKKYDLIIGNPPFIKKNNYSVDFKASLELLSSQFEYSLKELKNSWAAFVVASNSLLTSDGILSFIVPYELMTVSYGQSLQHNIFPQFERVDVYIPDQKAFKEIEQDAIFFVAQKRTKEEKGIFIHRVEELNNLSILSTQKINYISSKNISLDLKAFLLEQETTNLLHNLRSKCTRIGDFCESSPGIVTGANDFFILTKEQVEQKNLLPYARKILKKGSFLTKRPMFTTSDFKNLELSEACYLLDFNNISHDELSEAALNYISEGEARGVHLGYKCRNRKNWYAVPILDSTEGFFFKRSHTYPRLCINNAGVLVTDTAYQIRLKNNISIKALCFSFYNSLTLLFSEIDGRFYGGGVLELTPKEFKSLPIVYYEPTDTEFEEFLNIHLDGGRDTAEKLQLFGDKWLSLKLGLDEKQLSQIQEALVIVRKHRLRHGE